MKNLVFQEGTLRKEYTCGFESSLFNRSYHRLVQSEEGWVSFYLVEKEKRKVLASCHFHIHESHANSPLKAPFGSIEFSDELQPKQLHGFLQQVERSLREAGVTIVTIKNPPPIYQPEKSTILEVLLLNHEFKLQSAEINSSLVVDDVRLEEKMDAGKQRKLKQAMKAGLTFQCIPLSSLGDVYRFISGCRDERNQTLSMNFDDLKKTVDACSGDFHLFGVFQNQFLAAASIAVRVESRILYNFYPAHSREFDSLSPLVMLLQGMYAWCREQRIKILDLGTSAIEGHPNFGLLDFKTRMGSISCMKSTFIKQLR